MDQLIYDNICLFHREDALTVIECLSKLAESEGYATVDELFDLCDTVLPKIPGACRAENIRTDKFGWKLFHIKKAKAVQDISGGWRISIPNAIKIHQPKYKIWADMTFAWRGDAELVLDMVKDFADKFGKVTVADYCALIDIREPEWPDNEEFWLPEDLKNASVRKTNGKPTFYILLPKPRPHDSQVPLTADRIIKILKEYANKEENIMAATKEYTPEPTPVVEEDLDFAQQKKELIDEAEKAIFEIKQELAQHLKELEEERFWEQQKKIEKERARSWRLKYNAMIDSGFTEEQAWEMCMKSFEAD